MRVLWLVFNLEASSLLPWLPSLAILADLWIRIHRLAITISKTKHNLTLRVSAVSTVPRMRIANRSVKLYRSC